MRYRVTICGWAEDETFEDHADVDAVGWDAAVAAAKAVMMARWNIDFIEVGDVEVEELGELSFQIYADGPKDAAWLAERAKEQEYEIEAERRNEQALADAGMY